MTMVIIGRSPDDNHGGTICGRPFPGWRVRPGIPPFGWTVPVKWGTIQSPAMKRALIAILFAPIALLPAKADSDSVSVVPSCPV